MYGSGRWDFSELRSSGWEAHGDEQDPGLVDPDGADDIIGTPDDDLRLDGTQQDDGDPQEEQWTVTIQGEEHRIGTYLSLDPEATDWTTTPPVVRFVDQRDHGPGWERGAYAFTR
jgi:hypothetical protein